MRESLESPILCNKMWVLAALVSVVLASSSGSHSIERRESSEKRVVCYYTNWSVYRPGTAKYNPQNINPYLCTHLIYAFGGLDRENGLRPYDKYQDIEQGGYAKFTGLKSYNKNLKTMLAIGGWNEGSARFSPLVADEERRREFVKNVVKFLRVNHFDGLDLDWEYPAFRDGGKPRDRDNYAQLVQELREEFDREHEKTGRPRLLLTMAVPAGIEYIDKGYDVPKLNRYLDFMNILSYDYHSAFEPAVNHHSPLYPLEEDNEYNFDAQLSIDYTVKHYLKAGADRDKLVLGIPTYGRSYTLFNPDSTDLGAPADGPGEQGDATREKGYLAYYEICSALRNEDDWQIVQPKVGAMGPYAFRKNQWVGYDDMDIVKQKATYVNEQGLGGIMFWSIDNDDFRGKCHDRPYPLIEAAKEALYASSAPTNNLVSSSNKREKTTSLLSSRRPSVSKTSKPKVSRTTTTPAPKTAALTGNTTPEPPTTPDPGSDFVCKDEGFFPHPRDCKKYFWCLDSGPSNLGIVAHQFTCPSGLFFNKAADSCDYTRNVLCNKKEKATTAAPKVTAATARTTAGRGTTTTTTSSTTTTSTTTEAPLEEEYEEEEEEEHEQEDPEAIKQLIQLIKKLGGVAELEKQLEGAGSGGVSTPSIPRSLYKKVLTPQRPSYKSPFRNGPSGPQNEGLNQRDDGSPYRREKPQYVTIRRERPSTEGVEEVVQVVTPSPQGRYKYTSIQRNRPASTQYEVTEPDEEISVRPIATSPRYQTIERSRPRPSSVEEEEEEEPFRPKYSTIQRSRPTTIEAIVENTTPKYVTLRRHRPQPEQQEEESTIKHAGETIIIEAEEEIKPINIDVEEPIFTSVRPKLKVSETPVLNTSTTELAQTDGEAAATTVIPSTRETSPSGTQTEANTAATEAETLLIESSSASPTTVPYQTSTLTSIVTVVVEGATERRRVPVTKLRQALADHDLLSNSLTDDSKFVPGKSSVHDKSTPDGKIEEKLEEKNRYRPIGNYRGRPRKPIVIEPPTTKALPLYLQRRRTTTESSGDVTPTEETQLTTKSRTFGRFTPSRTRDRVRTKPSTTESTSVVDETDFSTTRANRYRTSRPSTGGSRLVSRGRTRSTTTSPETELGEDDKRRKTFGNKVEGEDELVSEKPARLFTRGRLRTTTEKSTDFPLASTSERPTSRSRFVISRGRNSSRTTTHRTPVPDFEKDNESNLNKGTTNSPRSRFQIRRRKPKNETESTPFPSTSESTSTESSYNRTSEEEHEIMIPLENSSIKPNQISNDTRSTTIRGETVESNVNKSVDILNSTNDLLTRDSHVESSEVNSAHYNDTQSQPISTTSEPSDNPTTIVTNSDISTDSSPLSLSNATVVVNKTHSSTDSFNNTSTAGLKQSDDEEEEVLNVIASRYSEQSFTGARGNIRYQDHTEKEKQEQTEKTENTIADAGKKINSLQSRRRKVSDELSAKNLASSKSSEDSNKSSRRRKVLVRKNKVATTEDSFDLTTESVRRSTVRGRSTDVVRTRGRNGFTSRDHVDKQQVKNVQQVQRSRKVETRQRNVDESVSRSNDFRDEDFRKITSGEKEVEVEDKSSKRRKIVVRNRSKFNSLEENTGINLSGHKRTRVVVKKRKGGEDVTSQAPRSRGLTKFPDKDFTDLETGTSLFVQRETESDNESRGSFPRSVKDQPIGNFLFPTSRGKVKAKDSLMEDIAGVVEEQEDYEYDQDYADNYDQSEAGGTRVRAGFRRPSSATSRSRVSTTTTEATISERPSSKFFRRRVTKYKPERNVTVVTTTPFPDLYETTVKGRRFEFPRRTVRPSLNSLPQQAALVATTTPFIEITDNHSDESLHEVDTETVESKEVYGGGGGGVEEATNSLPDLANVAVAAIQSLATVPPSTSDIYTPVTASTNAIRRQTIRTSTSTTTELPRPNVRRGPPRPFSKVRIPSTTLAPKSQYVSRHKTYDDLAPDYEDYYAEPVEVPLSGKVRIHSDGYIECLDIGNFPHPFACKKFISCAKMENGHLLGWEYTCPRGLSFDPIGGICNWSAGLGCKE